LKGGWNVKFRKKDFIIFYILTVIIFAVNLMSPVKIGNIFAIVVGSIFPALILGVLTNFIFKKA